MASNLRDGLRVLLVAEEEALRDEVRGLLEGPYRGVALVWVSQPDLAMARSEEFIPSLILVDDGFGASRVLGLLRQLAPRLPDVPIVLLAGANGVGLASQATRAGARTFILKPLRQEDVVETVRQLLQEARRSVSSMSQQPAGRVIVFCAPRGGSGRTTLAVNTAIGLRLATDQPVVLVDADYAMPAIDVALNLHPEHDIRDLLPRLAQLDPDLLGALVTRHASGVDVVTAPEPGILSGALSRLQVEQLLVALRRAYTWVVIDVGAPLDQASYVFLDTADRVVLNLVPELVALRNARHLLDVFAERHYRQEKVWLVVNRANMPGAIPAGQIESRMRSAVHWRIPDDPALVLASINRGIPIILNGRGGSLVRAYRDFAQGIVKELGATASTEDEGAAGGLGARLSSLLGRGEGA